MDKSTNSENDFSFSLTFNLSSALIVATMFVLTSFAAILPAGSEIRFRFHSQPDTIIQWAVKRKNNSTGC